MLKGISASASGMIPQIKKQELTSNNIANVNSPGFKKDRLFTQELSRAQRKAAPTKSDWERPMVEKLYTSFAPGVFDNTGNPLDFAIEGDGFFTIELEGGGTVLTRSGSFSVDSSGYLSVPGGGRVMGDGGPIEVGSGVLEVSARGQVEVNGVSAGRIVPVSVDDLTMLEKAGASLFIVPDGVELTPVDKTTVRQGFLESSNVDIVREMVNMITSFRNYEANARAMQTQDRSLDQLFSRVAPKT